MGRIVRSVSKEWELVSVEDLRKNFASITANSKEATSGKPTSPVQRHAPHGEHVSGPTPKTPGLDQYTIDLTARARAGEIDPILGRDAEIRQVVDILMRRRQNNPILTGEAGVGKTAVVEGLALAIAAGEVPPPLQGVAMHILDLGLLQAGASVKGEFENRLRMVIDEVKRSPHPIILFIDEAHQMIGAGGSPGQGDAANLLKPALARGELRTIAATTWSEYKKYFEKDAALARRFQVIKVEEPSVEKAKIMLRGLVPVMEAHHKIRLLDEAVEEAVTLSARYLSGRQLPDKAVSVLDTACARVAISHYAVPPPVENLQRTQQNIEAELAALRKESAAGATHAERIKQLDHDKRDAAQALTALQERWAKEKALAQRIAELRAELEQKAKAQHEHTLKSPLKNKREDTATPAQLHELQQQLRALQGLEPLVHPQVDGQIVGEVISGWTGVPLGKMVRNEIGTVLSLRRLLEERVIARAHGHRQAHPDREGESGRPFQTERRFSLSRAERGRQNRDRSCAGGYPLRW
jgi:type VI secretion system protein VasG